MASPSRLAANEKYRATKCKQVQVQFTPNDMDLYDFLCSQGEAKATYIKRLIREDMERRNGAK